MHARFAKATTKVEKDRVLIEAVLSGISKAQLLEHGVLLQLGKEGDKPVKGADGVLPIGLLRDEVPVALIPAAGPDAQACWGILFARLHPGVVTLVDLRVPSGQRLVLLTLLEPRVHPIIQLA